MTSIRQALHQLLASPTEVPFEGEAEVADISRVGASYVRVTLRSEDFEKYHDPRPADALKLHLIPGEHRVYTIRGFDADELTVVLDIYDHGIGLGARWLSSLDTGRRVSFTGRRPEFYRSDDVDGYLFVGDASAAPAVATIFDSLDQSDSVTALLALPQDGDRGLLRTQIHWDVRWLTDHESLLNEVKLLSLPSGRWQGWVATETEYAQQFRAVILDRHVSLTDLKAGAYWSSTETWTNSYNRSVALFQELMEEGHDMTDPGILERLTFLEQTPEGAEYE
ncbi:siderophore-interacting protein [Rhodococcus sp. C3V]|uniref:siderophore-interacting protein n=1 Tax=Rhodococcus sp. C3V TaxID=3034165 RepID=UPI0023E28800|nr:siderophore-interacting protein [Rhodococcus sp. C3V]MDF3319713.1 siderophore-interacting protein [Rhodococcus sp. C3V]